MRRSLALLLAIATTPAIAHAQSIEDRARAAAEASRAKTGDSDTLLNTTITPGLSGQPIATVDNSKSFTPTLACQKTQTLLEILVQPAGSGDIGTVRISQDKDFNGTLDTVTTLPVAVSGICANGIISCQPGSWNQCRSFRWDVDSAKSLKLTQVSTQIRAQGTIGMPQAKNGYWWYEAPAKAPDEKPDPDALVKPAIPPMAELATWTPPKIRKLIEQQRDYAATVLTVDAVADFWKLQDFARRKARAFAGVTQIAMLQHPELSSKSANPMVGDARDQLTAYKDDARRQYLRAHAQEFALVMFSRSRCGYCQVQWPIVQRFQEEMGWQVTLMDIDRRPEIAQRFGVEVTPTTMIIRRGSQQRMVIANGVEAYPNLAQMAYQAVRLLTGDIRPEQFMTGAGEEDGFFDALANGPVSSTDPRVLGGDLVRTASEREP